MLHVSGLKRRCTHLKMRRGRIYFAARQPAAPIENHKKVSREAVPVPEKNVLFLVLFLVWFLFLFLFFVFVFVTVLVAVQVLYERVM